MSYLFLCIELITLWILISCCGLNYAEILYIPEEYSNTNFNNLLAKSLDNR